MAHAQLSPSSAERWITCPGSVALCRNLPDSSSSYADEGTAAHDLAAKCLESGKDAAEFIGQTVDKGFVVDSTMAGYVQQYVDFVRFVRDAEGSTLLVEQRLPIEYITGEVGATGTSDAVVLGRTILTVGDLKYGMGVKVEAENNPQLRIYALAALREFSMVQDFTHVRMVIHQPRLNHVSEATMTVEELEAFGESAWNAAVETRKEGADLVPSDKGCKFCRAKATCPALREAVALTVRGAIESPMSVDEFDDLTANTPTTETTSDYLSVAMSKVDLIEGWCKAVRAEAERRLLAGETVNGYKLVQGRRGSRQWKDSALAEQTLKQMRVPHDRMFDYSLVSPTTADKLAKEGVIGPRQWPRVLELITQSEGKPSVAPLSDKRPAISLDVSDAFSDLTQSTQE